MFRLRERNRITVDYLELDQAGTKVLTRPVQFGDQIYNPGATSSVPRCRCA